MLAWYCNIPYITIFMAMFAAILLSVVNRGKISYAVTIIVSVCIAVLSAIFLYNIILADTSFSYTMGKFPAPFGNEIKAGPLQGLLSLVFSAVMALALLGGRKDALEDIEPKKLSLYCVMINMTLASLLVLTYTNDAFTGYVFIEIGTIAACALVMAKDSGATLIATTRYLFMSLLGSGLFLLSLVILYSITGHLLMPQMAESISILIATGEYRIPLITACALLTAGLGIKGAMFPFHRWLPGAHGSATTASSAVLSGLVIKGYIVLLITFYVRVFSLVIYDHIQINICVFILGLAGMIVGSLYAIKETHIKRLLAYSSVAQIGYVFLGIGIGTELGITAAIFQILAHACTKPLLFICAGKLSATADHQKDLSKLRGSAFKAKLAGVGFTIGAFSMVGIPLLSGFSVKLNLATASIHSRHLTLLTFVGIALSTVLNALYYIPAAAVIWSGRRDLRASRLELKKPPFDLSFIIACIVLIGGVVYLGAANEPVLELIKRGFWLM